MRALPLLKPGKSLKIATLPAGQDPDDICRTGGAAAFETVLAGAVPLIDHVWTSETAGLETATPERRAQGRARLREAASSIADPDVKSLYQAEFNRRFEAAFMARPERPPWQPRKPGQKWQPPIPGASPALKAMVARGGDPLLTAVLTGLLLRPELADAHGDALSALQPEDDGEAALLALLLTRAGDPALAGSSLDAHLVETGLDSVAKRVRQANRLALSFTLPDMPATVADADFAMVLAQVTARAGLAQALAEATIRFRASLSDEDYEAQQALRQEMESLDAAMMRLAESRREG
jgi:DNA primase